MGSWFGGVGGGGLGNNLGLIGDFFGCFKSSFFRIVPGMMSQVSSGGDDVFRTWFDSGFGSCFSDFLKHGFSSDFWVVSFLLCFCGSHFH